MKEYVGIYIKTEKSTGTRWLWQQNEVPLPHNNPTRVYIARVKAKHKEAILMYGCYVEVVFHFVAKAILFLRFFGF